MRKVRIYKPLRTFYLEEQRLYHTPTVLRVGIEIKVLDAESHPQGEGIVRALPFAHRGRRLYILESDIDPNHLMCSATVIEEETP